MKITKLHNALPKNVDLDLPDQLGKAYPSYVMSGSDLLRVISLIESYNL
jgi:hypothetical protein